jgi:hypothetical protein
MEGLGELGGHGGIGSRSKYVTGKFVIIGRSSGVEGIVRGGEEGE